MNKVEVFNFLMKKAKLKPVNIDINNEYYGQVELRKYNSLVRILKIYIKYAKDIKPLFEANLDKIKEVSSHYYLDVWASDTFITFRVYKK